MRASTEGGGASPWSAERALALTGALGMISGRSLALGASTAWKRRRWSPAKRRVRPCIDVYEDTYNDRLRRLINHLARFADAVDYGCFKDNGWPVGPVRWKVHTAIALKSGGKSLNGRLRKYRGEMITPRAVCTK
jgi:hypothetical protein